MTDPIASPVLTRFASSRHERPGAPAVVADGVTHTYAELDALARRHAEALRAAGAGRETVVALVADRGPGYVAMMLGVLLAGAAFVPVEPSVPVRRARRMCADATVRALLVEPGHEAFAAEVVAGLDPRPSVLLAATEPGGPDPRTARETVRPRDGLAYVIFTSGSTGTPKGAMVADGGMDNHLAAKIADLGLGPADVVGLTAPLSFDISVWQTLVALTVGARTAVAAPRDISEPAELVAWVRRHGVTVLEIVPSFLAVLTAQLDDDLRAGLSSLRYLVATGEALPGAVAQRWYEHCPDIPIVNAYGPTECSDDVTHHVVTAAESAARSWPSIGREVLNTRLFVVDAEGHEVPDGTEGELLVGGHGVGRGYIGDPVRTALTFVPDGLSGAPGARLYRTADRVSRAVDGTIDFHGRRDRQVKIRGHRVELGDAEAELLRVPGVRSAACVFTGGRLRAFVTMDAPTDVAATVRASAPHYLVPHEVTVLERLPVNTSGKTDHRALAVLCADDPAADTGAATAQELDLDAVRELVAETLGVAVTGPDEDFFTAGGDSLLAMTLVAGARARFGAEGTSLRAFLSRPTPRGLLAAVEAAEPVTRGEEARAVGAVSSGQERLWFFEQLHRRKAPNLLILSLDLYGPLDEQALQHALAAVVARHEPLRTAFTQERGVPKAVLRPAATFLLEPGTADGFQISARTPEPPLAQARLERIADDHHVLAIALHHLIADGWSLEVLKRDIAEYYERALAGDTRVFPPRTAFSHYVAAERAWLESPDAEECTRYWTGELAGAPGALDLPLDRPRPAKPTFETDHTVTLLSADDTKALAETARAHGATPFMAVLAASYVVLREATSTTDLVLGIDSVNRSWPGSEELVGTFVNQLPVRLAPGAAPSFGDLLDLARRQVLGAQEHDRLPFHTMVAAVNPPRRPGRFPLFQVKVTHQSAWRTGMRIGDLRVEPRELADPVMDLDLMIDVSGENDRLRLELLFWPETVDSATVAAWARAMADVLRAGAAHPDAVLTFGER
ncbi:non-ribosomal peptide synthetase [Streptomyces sp. NPDC057067]|uniref:non-ribosomal peptide synthetase n=1 Tax=Streptomyces TaxID=1883 RepID=UPI00100FEB09|nr:MULTISPECIES: non-ribosomal peptide synthetase [Streptomyces]MBL1285920.1 amino acid adenylation domain-containing protein [Streptomyces silvae]